MIVGNARSFNAFPHIPAKAMDRKDMLEAILKRMQAIHTQLCYQVRMGDNDLIVKAKLNKRDDYRPYVTISIVDLGPNNTVPDWDIMTKMKRTLINKKVIRGVHINLLKTPESERESM